MTARETAGLARQVEALGYGVFWFPEIQGRNAFVQAGWLLAATERLHVATGIANIFLREPYATATAQRTLAEQSEGRFVLGLGISHAPFVEHVLGRQYQSPASALEAYLDRMEGIIYSAPEPTTPAPTVLAALGPRLLRLAARRTFGSHSLPGTARAHRAGARDPRARAVALRRAESPPRARAVESAARGPSGLRLLPGALALPAKHAAPWLRGSRSRGRRERSADRRARRLGRCGSPRAPRPRASRCGCHARLPPADRPGGLPAPRPARPRGPCPVGRDRGVSAQGPRGGNI